MGTSSDASSSSAAQRAQDDTSHAGGDDAPQRRGFVTRLLSRIGRRAPAAQPGPSAAPRPEAAFRASLGNLRSLRVEDVAIPSVEISAVPVDITREALIEVFRKSGYTRLPVYDGTLDNPLGLIHLKDIALRFGFDCAEESFDLRALIRPLIFAPPSMPIGVLLGKMQSSRIHMALVIDEYGGVDGLLTIEDLIEQVLGEIEDEHDQEEGSLFTEEKPGCWLASARTPLDQFEAALGTHLAAPEDQEEIDTLGGLVFMLTGRVPARGEVIPHPDGLEFEVIDADARHIKRLRVRRASAAVLPGPGTGEGPKRKAPRAEDPAPGIRVDAAE